MRRSRASVCLSLSLRQSPQSDIGNNRPVKQTHEQRRNWLPFAMHKHKIQYQVGEKFGIFIIILHYAKMSTKGFYSHFPFKQHLGQSHFSFLPLPLVPTPCPLKRSAKG